MIWRHGWRRLGKKIVSAESNGIWRHEWRRRCRKIVHMEIKGSWRQMLFIHNFKCVLENFQKIEIQTNSDTHRQTYRQRDRQA